MPAGHRPAPPTGTARVAIAGTVFTLPYLNVFWLRLTDDGTQIVGDLNSVIGTFLAAYNTNLVAQMGSCVAGGTATAEWITSPGNALESLQSVAFTPSGNTCVNDAAASWLIDWGISDRYRGGHPRSYMPGPNTAHITNGSQIDGTMRPSMATSAAAFLTAANAITHGHITKVELGTVAFSRANVWLTPPVFKPYTSSGIRLHLASQRRRIGA